MRYFAGVMVLAGLFALPAHAAAPNPALRAKQFELAAGKTTKLLVDQDGWYRVSFTALRNAGFVVPRKTANLQLWVDGAQVPIKIPRGAIEFYGTALDTDATDTRSYWLVNGTTKGLRIGLAKVGARVRKPAGSFPATATFTARNRYFAAILNGEKSNRFGAAIYTGTPATVKLPLQHVASAPGSLKVTVQGFSLVNHVVKVSLNGSALGNITFKGQILASAAFPLPAGAYQEGDNTVTLAAAGGEIDITLVSSVELSYQHAFVSDGDVLTFPARSGQVTTVGGFSTKNIRLIDISRPDRPRELVPTRGGVAGSYAATFVPLLSSKQLYAFANFKALTPKLEQNTPSQLNASASAADLVMISHATFIPALKPLAELRHAEGFTTQIVDIQDVYDEFNYGAKDPTAIKDFLVWTRDHWTKAPHYVLLVGDGSNDPRNFAGSQNPSDFVPTTLVDTQYLESPSDDSLADFNADGIPEMAVGRLPVQTPQEATIVVGKLTRYDQVTRPRSVLLVADKNIDYDFEALSRQLAALIPSSVSVSNVFRNQGPTDAAVRTRLLGALNQGPSIVNFYGHGAIQIWTSGSILKHSDADNLTNGSSLSVYLMMTCLNGYFVDPTGRSLGETLVLSPGGGAVATWSSSGETVPTDQVVADQEAVKLLLNTPNITLGDAMVQGKSVIRDIDVRHTWVLLGDPTTRLH